MSPRAITTALEVVSSPVYTDPATGFKYNVVGALSTVSFRFKSLQAKLVKVTNWNQFALIEVSADIKEYLEQVAAAMGTTYAQVYIEDTDPNGFNYSKSYNVHLHENTAEGHSQLELHDIANDNTKTFYGVKSWADNYDSQCVYQYRNNLTFEVYDTTPANGIVRDVLLYTNRTQLAANGYASCNISELAKGYVGETGGIGLSVKVTSRDFFGNAAEVMTEQCILVRARVPQINYGSYIMYNPENKGQVLPTTGYRLFYGAEHVWPFYVNFITNDLMGEEGITVRLTVSFCKAGSQVGRAIVQIPTVVGLNVIDLTDPSLVAHGATIHDLILQYQPDTLRVTPSYVIQNEGEFESAQFTNQYFIFGQAGDGVGATVQVPCVKYELDNRRDFYFVFQNGIGGLSSYLCTEYTRQVDPEIVALRNADTIGNSIARETETVELVFKYTDLIGLKFLFGYDIHTLTKVDGVYESITVTRVGAKGDKVTWIVSEGQYDLPNSTKYKDISFSVYRPIGMTQAQG